MAEVRLKAIIQYDGSAFYGSQFQKHHQSVLGNLQKAFKSAGVFGKIQAASRTDKGVHALGNVLSVTSPYIPSCLTSLKSELNKKIAPFIYIQSLDIVEPNFNPRFKVKERFYRYIISPPPLSPFTSRYTFFYHIQSFQTMKLGLNLFNGEHDFYLFSKSTPSLCTTRKLETQLYTHKNHTIFCFKSQGFLHSQIRFIMGALILLDQNKLTQEHIIEQLQTKRTHSRFLAPPQGLYLARIVYEKN
ncbi:tRNA pseudouridine(38-40) synthase TruA [Helicobacter monodelphidis]|uniref:tRNA pseudouridine(38-40) synthase TruA n=1 Tax=Helicobacter sp. 15-1451 TaxID=2004995 RepID=UPI000DCD4EB3|nr:tRNA pseudouridine(38-40) synthase TruA [Helicobacter sp. 15-1451]RAX57179.1 tRNA pseudouridine(38-40) synthase TruA [Helicobacter sp. 15-1451]